VLTRFREIKMNKKTVKDIEIILGILLVLLILKYFFLPNMLNLVTGYEVYNSDCSMRVEHMEAMTIGGTVIDDVCNTGRLLIIIFIVIIIILMLLIYGLYKYRKK